VNIFRPRIGWRDAQDAYTIVFGVNHKLRFDEGGGVLSALTANGTYSDLELAARLKVAMDALGGDYAVWRDDATALFNIQRLDAGVLNLTPIGATASIYPTIGFTTNRSGAVAYAADLPTPDLMYLDLLDPVRSPVYENSRENREDNVTLTGSRYSCDPSSGRKKWEADLRFHAYAELATFLAFYEWALLGGSFRWWPDQSDPTRWALVHLDDKKGTPRERLPAFKNWDFHLALIQATPNTGTIELEELQDR